MTAPTRTAAPRRKVLLAPVTVGPTKPLVPSHLKVLLSMDILHRATATFADVTHVYHPLAHAGSRQVAGFWEYLDRRHPGLDFGTSTEEEIGGLYREFSQHERVPYAALEPFVRRAGDGWTHPATARLLDLWEGHYRTLGLLDPRLGRTGPAPMPAEELIELLVRHDLCIDGRPLGAPVYLDAAAAGLPLRTMVGADGHANYLMSTLCEIVPQLAEHDHVVLAHDPEIRADYRTIAHVLTTLGAEVSRVEFTRVPLDGVAQGTRHGGWHGYTVGALSGPLVAEFGAPAFALGLRLYLVAELNRAAPDSFSVPRLRHWVRRAVRLLAEHGDRPGDAELAGLSALAGRMPYVDPYRLVTTLLSRGAAVPTGDLLDVVLGPAPRPAPAAAAAPPLNFASTVDLALLHRRNPDEAFLTDAVSTGPDGFVAAAVLPPGHPHYAGHTGPSRDQDPMLLLECARQAETYAAHTMYGVEQGAHFVLRNWSAEFAAAPPPSAGPVRLTIACETANARRAGNRTSGLDYDLRLRAGGAQVGRVRMEVGYVSAAAYRVIRSRRHQGAPPSSDDLLPAAGQPVDPARVGRRRATDAVLLDVAADGGTVTAALRVPVENASMFDHAQDHVPAMVLIEAARQIAALATAEWGGGAADRTRMTQMSAAFDAYAELTEPIVITATPSTSDDIGGGLAVDVTFGQAGTAVARARVVMAVPVPAERSVP